MTASLRAFILQRRFRISREADVVSSYNGSASIPFPSHGEALKSDSSAVESIGFNKSMHRHFARCVSFHSHPLFQDYTASTTSNLLLQELSF